MRNPGLTRCIALVLVASACAHAAVNDDLVFDQDGKQSFAETPLIEIHQQESLLHRIKRGFFDVFGLGPSTTTTTETPPDEAEAKDVFEDETPIEPEDKEPQVASVKAPANLERLPRDSREENDEAEVDNEVEDVAEGRREPPKFGNSDDEDLAGSGEVEGSAGDAVGRHPGGPNGQRKYYRITLTVGEPYIREYADRNSQQYKELSGNVTQGLEELYNRHIPSDRHYVNVVKISPTTSDSFTSQVTLDIGSTFTDELEVRNILEEQLEFHSLGSIQVRPEGFTFRVFHAGEDIGEEECNLATELTCRDGACVPLDARCDGIAQCEDGSDELDCPTTVTALASSTPSVHQPLESVTEVPVFFEVPVTPTEPTEDGYREKGDESTLRSAMNDCRGDDTMRCSDGSRYICSVQQCDGVPDCEDGGDEAGCADLGCSAGEFACDVTRCILEAQRCNFATDCDDGSDEHDCSYPACTSTQFKCRNGQCIDSGGHCNGAQDCHDGTDELNCPCREDQFECTPGFCVPLFRRCDGVLDCNGGMDEENCRNMTRCRPDQFECASGSCVGQSAICDGRSDCPDRSDEHNCNVTTCSAEQFRCLDGTCLSIDKRCNHVSDCRNGEDENQCGCGEKEFRCTDGRCIGYELQCNGVDECSDGSDERDCEKYPWRNVYNDERSFAKKFHYWKPEETWHAASHRESPKSQEESTRRRKEETLKNPKKLKNQSVHHYSIWNNVIANSIEESFAESAEGKPTSRILWEKMLKTVGEGDEAHLYRSSVKSARSLQRSLKTDRNSTSDPGSSKKKRRRKKKRKHPLGKTTMSSNVSTTLENKFLGDSSSTSSTVDFEESKAGRKRRIKKKKLNPFGEYYEKHLKKLITSSAVDTSTVSNALSSSVSLDIETNEVFSKKASKVDETSRLNFMTELDLKEEKASKVEEETTEWNLKEETTSVPEEETKGDGSLVNESGNAFGSKEDSKGLNFKEENATTVEEETTEWNMKEETTSAPEEKTKGDGSLVNESGNAFGSKEDSKGLNFKEENASTVEEETTEWNLKEETTSVPEEETKGDRSLVNEPGSAFGSKEDSEGFNFKEENASTVEEETTEWNLKEETASVPEEETKGDGSLLNESGNGEETFLLNHFFWGKGENNIMENVVDFTEDNGSLLQNEIINSAEEKGEQLLEEKIQPSSIEAPNGILRTSSSYEEETTKFSMEEKASFSEHPEVPRTKWSTEESLEESPTPSPAEETTKFQLSSSKDSPKSKRSSGEEIDESFSIVEDIAEESTQKPNLETLDEDINRVSKESSGSREDIYRYKAKKHGAFAKYFHKYLEGSVSPSPTTTPASNWSVKVESGLFDSNSRNSEVDLLSKDRLSNQNPGNDSTSDQSFKDNVDKCTSKCAEFWRNAYERERKKSRGDIDANRENIDSSLASAEKTTMFKPGEENCTDLTVDLLASTEVVDSYWEPNEDNPRTSFGITKTTESTDLVEVITSPDVVVSEKKKPGRKKKRKDRKKKDKKHRGKNQVTEPTSEQRGTTSFNQDTLYTDFNPTLLQATTSSFPSGGAKEFLSKETVDKDDKHSASPTTSSTDLPSSSSPSRCSRPEDQDSDDCNEDTTTENSEETPGGTFSIDAEDFTVVRETTTKKYVCERNQWFCDRGLCISKVKVCDGVVDCQDTSDEENCSYLDDRRVDYSQRNDTRHARCGSYEFLCDGRCLSNVYSCNGVINCLDRQDEAHCGDQVNVCPSGMFRCHNGLCLDSKRRCDGRPHCLDGSDEIDCQCAEGKLPCDNGVCINKNFFCDANVDCHDGSDERDCPETGASHTASPQRCRHDEFTCRDGSCISRSFVCDGRTDCPHGDDEANCHRGCGKDQFQCANGDCVRADQKCNGYIDCEDGSDESSECDRQPVHPMPGQCPSGYIMCTTDKDCVPQSSLCNGIPECRDRSDEENCGSPAAGARLNLKTYPSEQVIKENPAKQGREVVFQCRDEGPLRAGVRWLRGDNLPLPPHSRDINGRLEIPNIQLDHSGPYICEAVGYPLSTPGHQVTVHLTVEKFEPPPTNKPHVCQYDEATCSNGDCIPKLYVCNGRLDCTDGSDEMRCSPHGCEPNEFRCNNTECVSKLWRCDGDRDCADGSDEENCVESVPGSPCRFSEYACASGQCIPKTYHCDLEKDCMDGSDEIGCSPVYIVKPPPPMVTLAVWDVLLLTCTAIGVPTPEINWRLNWGHIPAKCTMTSANGTGTLTCPDMQVEDQGAYSCEGLNSAGFEFAVPDTIVMVKPVDVVCPKGSFNSEARSVDECISCFCFGVATECSSANLFTYQIPPPFDRHRFLSVEQQPTIRVAGDISGQVIESTSLGRDGVMAFSTEALQTELSRDRGEEKIAYFSLPQNYHGGQLESYGGYLKYRVRYNGTGLQNSGPSVILTGNNYTLVHRGPQVHPGYDVDESVRFFQGEWMKRQGWEEVHATRQDIMMTLANVENILIKAQYDDSPNLDVRLTSIVMDTADVRNTGLGSAIYVEECQCPAGYSGLSCEQCAPGFLRRETGPWLGQCYRDEPPCPPGYYGDPSRNIPCQVCPCPQTTPSNQFTRTCHLGSDGQPTCDCPPGYVGRRCQQCDVGYQGNPLIPGDKCVLTRHCDPDGSLTHVADPLTGACRCKQYATGLTCNQCKANTFNLASKNQFGCIGCFCMGITNRCVSSNWYRSDIRVSFTNSVRDFSLIESKTPDAPAIVDGIRLDTVSREILYNDFPNRGNNDVYYWQLPSIFLGDQITSYGGNLKYTVRYVPAPGGQSSRNNAADVELISANDINLLYFSRESREPNTPQTFTVPLLEQYWQRNDGTQADREHLLMALADVRAIRIKATYTTHTDEAALSLVSLDTAEKSNTGRSRAVEVEECSCPAGYKGLSCEDCDVGYTRASEGLYLGICEPCNCNGHSNQCNPDTGICENCAHHTTGDFCDVCEPRYEGDATRGTPYDCEYRDPEPGPPCSCNAAGSRSSQCIGERCDCKKNVEGPECNRCRESTFGLSAENPDGCSECYCSGVTNQCHESSLYVQQIPVSVYDAQHSFTLTDSSRLEVIDEGFELNFAMNEIGYRYPDSRGRSLFWSLPTTFTGNKVKSYGGNLSLTQHITAYPGAQSYKDQDIILVGNGITLFWTNPAEIQPDVPLTYSVPLRESEWRRLTTGGPRVASRVDLMTVLSNLEAILVRASHSERMTATYISDISMDTAVEHQTGNRRAVQVEVCRCPPGYTGTSCESCARGHYRDTSNRSASYVGSCSPCPCNKNEESCEVTRTGQVRCHCLPGYTGQYCQDTGELMVSLTPMNGEVKPNSWVLFTCSYESPDPLYIYFKLSPYHGWPLTASSDTPGPITRTQKGYLRTWHVYVQLDPCNVECYIENRSGEELIKVVTSVTPESPNPTTIAPYPTISPPRILVYIKGRDFQIVESGSSVRYHCSGKSVDNGSLHITWDKEGGELPAGRSVIDSQGLLIIRDVKVSDSGVYVCQVSDGVHVAFKNVTLTVGPGNQEAPRAVITPASLHVVQGQPAEFRCEATGNPPPQIEWMRVHGPMNPEVITQNGFWTLRAVSKNDAAEYKCVARNNVGVYEETAILYVRDDPNKPPVTGIPPTITPGEWTGSVGEVIRITCTPSQVTNLTWTREGNQPLPYTASQRDGVLTIMNPTQYDSGVYVCTATSYVGTETSSVIRITVLPRRPTTSVKVKPEKQTVPQGSFVEVRCLTSGEPGLQTRWSKYLEVMGPNAMQVGDTLRIVNVQIADRGVYVCRVTGPTGSYEASSIIEVEPREAPVLELHPKEPQTVLVGGSADVQCRAIAGTPMPQLLWSRQDGRPLHHNIKQLPGGVLRLTNITATDGGGYVCSASNTVSSTLAIAYIEVQSTPVIKIAPSSGILNVKSGDNVRLMCSASGSPQPNVVWTKHVNSLHYVPSMPKNEGTPLSAVYEILSVSPSDEGSYTCLAANAAGTVEERVYVRVDDHNEVYPPCRGDMPCPDDKRESYPDHHVDPIRIPEDYFRIPNGGKVEMRCQVYASNRNPIYLDWKRNDHHPLPEGSTVHNGVLTIPVVEKSAAGEYVCLGTNEAGAVLFRAKSHLEVLSPPRIVLTPPRQTVGPGENPSIICSATGDEPMIIEWAAIGRNLPHSVSHDRGVLHFHGITYSDAGKYVCKASNDAGTAEAVAEVLVNDYPYEGTGVRATQRDVSAYAGHPVRLQCVAAERADVHWSREEQALPTSARIEGDFLELPRAMPEDSGRYICQIETAHGVSSDYINLNVSLVNLRSDCTRESQTRCWQRKCVCSVEGCLLLLDYSCDVDIGYAHGQYDVRPRNRHSNQQRRATVLPTLSVEASKDPVNIGDSVDIRCAYSGTHSPRYHWNRPNHPSLPDNAQEYGSVLRLLNVAVGDSGVYRCTADTAEGVFEQDYNLVVHGGHNDAPAVETKYAPYGSDVVMDCKPNIDSPGKFQWSKLGGLLRKDAQVFESKLKLTNVKAEDAGTYICTVSTDYERLDITRDLYVTGVVPYFSQAPESFIALPPLPDSYLKFNIEVSFKPENYDGIILYNAQFSHGSGDFMLLALVRGYPQFSFDLGSGPTVIRADKPVSLSEWHTIKLQRNRKEGTMLVDGESTYKGIALGRKQGLDLKELLFVGGVSSYSTVTKHAEINTGFVGCISRLVIGEKEIDLIGDQTDSIGITNCETCAVNPCNNGGACQEAATKHGYTCLCRAGYSGKYCDYVGQACYPGACGEGTCVDKEGNFECYCPHGKTGSRCESSMKVYEPAFHDDKSFIAHETPKALRRARMSTTHRRLRSRDAQVRTPRSRPHHHNNPHHTNH
ncbi:terribly reduced optic lobes isoform X2 [Andrena cerasifolii]|uniref:terribly reduced optic lobes isoform X2 n=1 Tax=Andrena cerasifolii TaxID=2819439 RepID=UPI004037EDB8